MAAARRLAPAPGRHCPGRLGRHVGDQAQSYGLDGRIVVGDLSVARTADRVRAVRGAGRVNAVDGAIVAFDLRALGRSRRLAGVIVLVDPTTGFVAALLAEGRAEPAGVNGAQGSARARDLVRVRSGRVMVTWSVDDRRTP